MVQVKSYDFEGELLREKREAKRKYAEQLYKQKFNAVELARAQLKKAQEVLDAKIDDLKKFEEMDIDEIEVSNQPINVDDVAKLFNSTYYKYYTNDEKRGYLNSTSTNTTW